MAEYIEREAVLEMLKQECSPMVFAYLTNLVNDIPAADVRLVVRGKWIDTVQSCHDSPHVKCSMCGEYYWRYFNIFNFCPNCGADMREES